MSTLFWVVMFYLGTNVLYLWYQVDRPRKPKTVSDALFATAELAALAWAIYALAS